jgi:2-methylcitrate dehydratase
MELSSRRIADFALGLSFGDLGDGVVEAVERRALDALGCAVGAFAGEPCQALRDCFGDRTGTDRATLLGTDDAVSVEYAALVNATMARYLDFNDCYTNRYGGGHPSDHIPALLSVAEARGASGSDLVAAIAVAYEIQCRGLATGAVYRHGLDAQSVWGAYSATAAAGKLMGLSADELVDAIGICGASTNGLLVARRGDVSMWKGVAMPHVVHSAVEACQMAEHGVTGPERLFEGSGGVFEVLTDGPVDLPLGEDGYEVTRTSIKPHAGCYHALPAVTGLFELFDEYGLAADDISAVEVGTYETAYGTCATDEKWARDLTRETADHSLPYVLAVAALEGDVRPEHYRERWLESDAVHDLMERISVDVEAGLTARRGELTGATPTTVRVATGSETVETTVDYPLGHPERPLSDDAVVAKARTLLEPYLSPSRADEVVERALSLSEQPTVDGLVDATVV